METLLIISVIVISGFILFSIYYFFKQIQFVLLSVNLYKKMVEQQNAIICILLDVRDQTKTYGRNRRINELEEESSITSNLIKSISRQNNENEGIRKGDCKNCVSFNLTKVNSGEGYCNITNDRTTRSNGCSKFESKL